MGRKRHPRRGSLAFKPKTRAANIYPTLDSWKESEEVKVLGFAGYKAGMTRVLRVEDESGGGEVADAVTVIETPPLRVFGLRGYKKTGSGGKEVLGEIWTETNPQQLARVLSLPETEPDKEEFNSKLDQFTSLKLLVHTQPWQAGVGKKTPEAFELPLGGQVEQQLETGQELLGQGIYPDDSFTEGEYLDVIGVTKGKGFQSSVKRHGVKVLRAKAEKVRRKAGNLGPWHPTDTDWRVPQTGQEGFHRRTELNKRLLAIGDKPDKVNQSGGFKNYGVINGRYLLLKGSVPGAAKRLVMLRSAIRKDSYPQNPDIRYVEQ